MLARGQIAQGEDVDASRRRVHMVFDVVGGLDQLHVLALADDVVSGKAMRQIFARNKHIPCELHRRKRLLDRARINATRQQHVGERRGCHPHGVVGDHRRDLGQNLNDPPGESVVVENVAGPPVGLARVVATDTPAVLVEDQETEDGYPRSYCQTGPSLARDLDELARHAAATVCRRDGRR